MKSHAVWILALMVACTHSAERRLPINDSMRPSEIIRNKASLDGKGVKLSGYLVVEFEDRGIWDSKEIHENNDGISDCVSLLIPRHALADMERLSRTHAVIEGRIVSDLRSRGTVNLGICNLVAIEVRSVASLDAGR